MNTHSNAMTETALGSQAPAVFSATRPMYWSLRRELWENRSLYVAPLAAAAVFLFGFLISLVRLRHRMLELPGLDAEQQHHAIIMPYHMAAALIMGVALVVGIFYALDALYGERRDRSILFWKSLPVSDRTTVLSKASIAIIFEPLLAFAITVALQWIMLLLSSAVLMGSGESGSGYWAQVALFQMSLMLLYHLVTVHILWHAPIYGWMLLVSAWAKRATFLWAFLPPIAICVVEKIAFNSTHFGNLLILRLAGGPEAVGVAGGFPVDAGMHITPGNFLLSPGLWIGLIVAAAFLAGAVRLRRYREPI